jgi:hypothetical protein
VVISAAADVSADSSSFINNRGIGMIIYEGATGRGFHSFTFQL